MSFKDAKLISTKSREINQPKAYRVSSFQFFQFFYVGRMRGTKFTYWKVGKVLYAWIINTVHPL